MPPETPQTKAPLSTCGAMKMPFADRESFLISVKFLSDMKLLKVMFALVTVAWASALSVARAMPGLPRKAPMRAVAISMM